MEKEISLNEAIEKIAKALADGNYKTLDIRYLFRQQGEGEYVGRVLIEKKSQQEE